MREGVEQRDGLGTVGRTRAGNGDRDGEARPRALDIAGVQGKPSSLLLDQSRYSGVRRLRRR